VILRNFLVMMFFFCVAFKTVPVALADYYKYTDTSGAVNMTNKLDSVPQKYRSRMKVIRDDAQTKKDTGTSKQQQSAPPQEESSAPEASSTAPAAENAGKFAALTARYVWFKPLAYLVAILASFLVVVKLTALVPSTQLSKLIYLSFFLGVFVFLYKAYVEHVVTDALAVKEKTITIMKKANAREIQLPGEAPPAENK